MKVEEIKAKVKEIFDQKVNKLLENNAEQLNQKVDKILKEATSKYLKNFLGFEYRWCDKSWNIDYTNGRNGNSFIGKELQLLVARTVSEWLKNNFKPPEMNKKLLLTLQKEYNQFREEHIRARLHDLAIREVDKEFESIFDKVTQAKHEPKQDNDYQTYLKLKKKYGILREGEKNK